MTECLAKPFLLESRNLFWSNLGIYVLKNTPPLFLSVTKESLLALLYILFILLLFILFIISSLREGDRETGKQSCYSLINSTDVHNSQIGQGESQQ